MPDKKFVSNSLNIGASSNAQDLFNKIWNYGIKCPEKGKILVDEIFELQRIAKDYRDKKITAQEFESRLQRINRTIPADSYSLFNKFIKLKGDSAYFNSWLATKAKNSRHELERARNRVVAKQTSKLKPVKSNGVAGNELRKLQSRHIR